MTERIRFVIVGAGFGGLGMAIKLKERGETGFVILEKGADVGGTWRDNTYPGCQCDVPSNLYSYSFARNPKWTRTFPTQPEILEYLRECADRFDVRKSIRFNTTMEHARWDSHECVWHIRTNDGDVDCDVLICAQGGLSEPSIPDLPGMDTFRGAIFHSQQWNHGIELTGKRVAVVGTGASAVQFIPKIQPQVAHLDVYQRTPPWIMPHRDRAVSRVERVLFQRSAMAQQSVRGAVYWGRESFALAFAKQPRIMKLASKVAARHLRAQVEDPGLRAKLTPDYAMGCKRILLSNEFYPAISQPNAELVTHAVSGCSENAG